MSESTKPVEERRIGQEEILSAIDGLADKVEGVGRKVDSHIQTYEQQALQDAEQRAKILEVTHGPLTDEVDVDGHRVRGKSPLQELLEAQERTKRQQWSIGHKLTLAGILATLLGAIVTSL